MKLLLILFLGVAILLWLSIFGYLFLLVSVVPRRHHRKRGASTWPEIAIVIPTLNEEHLILPKLADLKGTDYPRDRITTMVVDGGSGDRTTELIRQEIARGEPITLVCLNGIRGKADQVSHALGLLPHEIVVVSDADSVLDPSCIRELVSMLLHDPQTAVVGATVRPDSALLEECIHWQFLNYLWWLEGEVLASASISGVCYACRRETILPFARDAQTEDIHMAVSARARGYRVRTCRTAHATEVRVPQTPRELVRFRRRRGAAYVSELLRSLQDAHAPAGWRLARLMRLWHFLVTPKVGVGLAVTASVLLGTPHWPWPLFAFAAFALPALAVLLVSTPLEGHRRRWWTLSLAASRWVALTLVSMLTLRSHSSTQSPIGGKS